MAQAYRVPQEGMEVPTFPTRGESACGTPLVREVSANMDFNADRGALTAKLDLLYDQGLVTYYEVSGDSDVACWQVSIEVPARSARRALSNLRLLPELCDIEVEPVIGLGGL